MSDRAATTWQPEIDELRRLETEAKEMGGADKVARQHQFGKLTVRERIADLVDPGSFHEIGAIAGKQVLQVDGTRRFQPANFVMGRAQLDGRPIVVGGDDFTVRGGASDASIAAKQVMAEQLANEYRVPIVRLVDGTGGGGSIKSLEESGLHLHPGQPGLGVGRRQPGDGARRVAGPRLGRRARRGAGSSPATTR